MNHSGAMSLVHGRRDLGADAQHVVRWQRPFANSLRESLSIEELYYQIIDPVLTSDVVESANVGVRKA